MYATSLQSASVLVSSWRSMVSEVDFGVTPAADRRLGVKRSLSVCLSARLRLSLHVFTLPSVSALHLAACFRPVFFLLKLQSPALGFTAGCRRYCKSWILCCILLCIFTLPVSLAPSTWAFGCGLSMAIPHLHLSVNLSEVARGEISFRPWSASGGGSGPYYCRTEPVWTDKLAVCVEGVSTGRSVNCTGPSLS